MSTDAWTSKQNYSYIGVNLQFVSPDFELKNFTVRVKHVTGSHNYINLKKHLFSILDEFKIAKFVGFAVTDNAANVKKAIAALVSENNLELEQFGCLAHIIKLIVKKSYSFKKKITMNVFNLMKMLKMYLNMKKIVTQILQSSIVTKWRLWIYYIISDKM